jgi:flagellar basal-body rod protein FlgG
MFDSIMRLATTNATRQLQSLADVSVNVANMNTSGYKNKRFEPYLTADNRLDGVTCVDASQGDAMLTQRELDFAIDGPGYLPVTQPDGSVAYTRDGSLALNSQGYLVTQRGDLVGEGIRLPVGYKKVVIKPNGDIKVKTEKNTPNNEDDFQPIGKISLVKFPNPEGLKIIGGNKLLASEESGTPRADTGSKIKQAFLERANVEIHAQVGQVLRLNAAIISNIRVIKFADDLYRQSVNLRQ